VNFEKGKSVGSGGRGELEEAPILSPEGGMYSLLGQSEGESIHCDAGKGEAVALRETKKFLS